MSKITFTKKSFDLGTASIAVLAAFGVQLFVQLIVSLFGLSDVAYTWTVVIANQVVLFGVGIFFCFYHKVDPLAITGAKKPPKWYYFPIFAMIALCCVLCFGPISGLFSRFLTWLGYDYTPQYYVPMKNGGLFALAFLALTILPIFGEEILLRGVLMSGTKDRTPLFSIFYTAMIFAFMHGNLNQIVHQFLLGAVMGYLVYLTGGIYASATVHFVNNALALLLDYGRANGWINKVFYWYVGGKLAAEPTIIGMSVSLFAILMLLVLVTCLLHRERSETKTYFPSDRKLSERITAYLLYLSTATKEEEEEATERTEKKPFDRYALVMAIVLAAVTVGVVLLTLIPGAGK